jgi:hypothetical protein
VLDDTWELDGDEWRELSPVARPPARQRHAMASYAGRVYVFGGASTASPRDSALLGDMWEWDGSQWRQVFSDAGSGALPEPSDHCAMSKLGDELVLLTATSRLHIWDGRTWSLREYDPARVPYIVPESAVELPVDADGPRLLIAGRGYGPYTSSEWDGTSWSGSLGLSVVMGPIALQGAALVSLAGTPLHTWLYASR